MSRNRTGLLVIAFAALLAVAAAAIFVAPWYGWGQNNPESTSQSVEVEIPAGTAQAQVGAQLQAAGLLESPRQFTILARLFGGEATIKAGSYILKSGNSWQDWVAVLQSGKVITRMLTLPEGMASVLITDRLLANPNLEGPLEVPPEGSLLPETYGYRKGEARAAVVVRMQAAQAALLDELWQNRSPNTAVESPEEAVILASIVEKETGRAGERDVVAGVFSNRLRQGMKLQADPTVIYPVSKGRALGRRIRRSELLDKNGYNTYMREGLPVGPITNPGRAAIEAVLNPADTKAIFFVADGKGGHAFAETLAQHQSNVADFYRKLRERGQR
jgi:UPF0755 protein